MMRGVGMSYEGLVDAVGVETSAIGDALGDGPVDARVATCPEWDVHTLARHLGEFTALWTHVVCEATGREKTPYEPSPPTDQEALAEWYRALAGHLVTALRGATADQPAWTWVPSQQHVGFIARRCANELAMHRYDVQSARGACKPIDAPVAAECVLEVPALVEGWAVGNDEYRHEGSGRSLHLCATDSDHEILLTMLPDRLDAKPEHSTSADLTLRGTMSDLALLAFDRPTLGSVERAGDDDVLGAWYEEFHFG